MTHNGCMGARSRTGPDVCRECRAASSELCRIPDVLYTYWSMLGGFPVGPFSGQSEYLIDFWLKARFPYPKTHMELASRWPQVTPQTGL